MLARDGERLIVNEETIDLIAKRLIAALRDDLDVIVVQLSARDMLAEQLTVGQVARQLGVARSTVYAHWREWGGYKLGPGDKAPIRFDSGALPVVATKRRSQQPLRIERVSSPQDGIEEDGICSSMRPGSLSLQTGSGSAQYAPASQRADHPRSSQGRKHHLRPAGPRCWR